jgi:transketolase
VIVLEEHSVIGGLGAAVAAMAAESGACRVCCIGIADRFSRYCGSYAYLMQEHGLDETAIRERVAAFLAHKRRRSAA